MSISVLMSTEAPMAARSPAPDPAPQTDEQLMAHIQEREPEALAALYDRYSGILKSLIMGVIHNDAEADDLLQEIYMEIWKQAAHYSVQKGKPLGWIVTLTRRRSIDRLRKKQAYARAEERLQNETEQQPEAWVHNTTEDDINMSDTRRLILGVLKNLPPAQREAIDLAFYHGMSQREIAAKTGIPLGTIKTRLELGLKKISEALKGMRDEF
jgi:RNA polymerase sigma-70 factor (ECF subfamily)